MSSSVVRPLSISAEMEKGELAEEEAKVAEENPSSVLDDEAHVCSEKSNGVVVVVEVEEEEEALEEEGSGETSEDEEEENDVVLLGPQVTLKEQLELDKDDDSLRRWKENLLGGVDMSTLGGEIAEPEVKILSLTISSPDRPDLVLPLPFKTNGRRHAFALKDGSRYRITFAFTVSNNIVSGLKYTNTVWKTGVKVDSTKKMLGTFSPQSEPYTYELEEETTPSGYFARGSYSVRTKFVDDDGKCHLDLRYCFEIRKDWPTS